MKWIVLSFLAVVLAFTACSKPNKPAPGAPPPIDLPKLRAACATGSPEIQTSANRVLMGIRTGSFAAAGAELEKLSANSDLTEAQKKVVLEVLEQVKANLARQPAPPGQ